MPALEEELGKKEEDPIQLLLAGSRQLSIGFRKNGVGGTSSEVSSRLLARSFGHGPH